MLVMGVDPGLATIGYGFVEPNRQGSGKAKAFGCVRTPANTPLAERLLLLHEDISALMAEHHPDVMAIEQLFFNRNTTTAFSVAQARGIVVLAAAQQGIEVVEYTPLQVKQAVVGYGRADKNQVQQMVKALLNLPEPPRPDDVADALAIAICHTHSLQYRNLVQYGKEQ